MNKKKRMMILYPGPIGYNKSTYPSHSLAKGHIQYSVHNDTIRMF